MTTFTSAELVNKVRFLSSGNFANNVYYDRHHIARYIQRKDLGCLLGFALLNMGVPFKFFRRIVRGDNFWVTLRNFFTRRTMNTEAFTNVFPELVRQGYITKFSYADRTWLCAVQEFQDSGVTWSDAVKSADEDAHNFSIAHEMESANDDLELPATCAASNE